MNYVSTIIGIAPINLVSYVFSIIGITPVMNLVSYVSAIIGIAQVMNPVSYAFSIIGIVPSDESDNLVRDSKYFSVLNYCNFNFFSPIHNM